MVYAEVSKSSAARLVGSSPTSDTIDISILENYYWFIRRIASIHLVRGDAYWTKRGLP